jgi:hypothetical protein
VSAIQCSSSCSNSVAWRSPSAWRSLGTGSCGWCARSRNTSDPAGVLAVLRWMKADGVDPDQAGAMTPNPTETEAGPEQPGLGLGLAEATLAAAPVKKQNLPGKPGELLALLRVLLLACVCPPPSLTSGGRRHWRGEEDGGGGRRTDGERKAVLKPWMRTNVRVLPSTQLLDYD